jgi:hypothetical protein
MVSLPSHRDVVMGTSPSVVCRGHAWKSRCNDCTLHRPEPGRAQSVQAGNVSCKVICCTRSRHITVFSHQLSQRHKYGLNALASDIGVTVELVDSNGGRHRPTSKATAAVTSPGGASADAVATVAISGVTIKQPMDSSSSEEPVALVSETWSVSLAVGHRNITVLMAGSTSTELGPGAHVRHTFPAVATSLFG